MWMLQYITEHCNLESSDVKRNVSIAIVLLFFVNLLHLLLRHTQEIMRAAAALFRLPDAETTAFALLPACGSGHYLCPAQMVEQMLFCVLIFFWIYGAPKYYRGYENLRSALLSLTGGSEEGMALWEKHAALFDPGKRDHDGRMACVVKTVYRILWWSMSALSIFCCWMFRMVPYRIPGVLTLALLLVSHLLCYYSWWMCNAYSYFLRDVSKIKSLTGFNRCRPSETLAFQCLLHDSAMTSVAFFIVSMLFSVILGVAVLLEGIVGGTEISQGQIVFMAMIAGTPGLISLIPVAVLPKLFLYRILRRWKREVIADYEERIRASLAMEERKKKRRKENRRKEREREAARREWSECIHQVSQDNLHIHSLEIAGTITAVTINVATIIATFCSGG